MALRFITGNSGKFDEMRMVLSPVTVKRVNIDLEEIQSLDPKTVIHHKLKRAFKELGSNFIIEDTCLNFESFKNKLPGPFARSFLEVLQPKGLFELAKRLGNLNAELRTIIAYAKSRDKVIFFESSTKGRMVKPRGKFGFGLDPVFMPLGSKKTLAELLKPERIKFSQRCKAALKLKKYLLK
jgi:XTP/dITP diphosphohydrolase